MVTWKFPDDPSGFRVDHQQREIIQCQRQHPAESNQTNLSGIRPGAQRRRPCPEPRFVPAVTSPGAASS